MTKGRGRKILGRAGISVSKYFLSSFWKERGRVGSLEPLGGITYSIMSILILYLVDIKMNNHKILDVLLNVIQLKRACQHAQNDGRRSLEHAWNKKETYFNRFQKEGGKNRNVRMNTFERPHQTKQSLTAKSQILHLGNEQGEQEPHTWEDTKTMRWSNSM